MNDPWADVRTDPNHGNEWLHEHTDDADGFVGDTVVVAEEDIEALLERLLTDADALLLVIPALEQIKSYAEGADRGIDANGEAYVGERTFINKIEEMAYQALAALPEHLHCGTKAGDS